MLDGLIGMFQKGFQGIGDLFSGGTGGDSLMASYTPEMAKMGVTEDIWNNAALGEKTGIMNSLEGLGLNKSLAGSGGILGGLDLMDLGKLGLGYMGMQEQKKNNKLNRTLTQQNIDENNRIKDGRTNVAGIFNSAPSLAAGY